MLWRVIRELYVELAVNGHLVESGHSSDLNKR